MAAQGPGPPGSRTAGELPKVPTMPQRPVSVQLLTAQCRALQRLNPRLWLQDLGSSPRSPARWLGPWVRYCTTPSLPPSPAKRGWRFPAAVPRGAREALLPHNLPWHLPPFSDAAK